MRHETCSACQPLLSHLRNAFPAAGDWEKITGLSYRLGESVHHTPDRPPRVDIDRLPPPARHLIPLGRYRTLGMPISLITSRGCPYRCIFCAGRRMVGAQIRYRQPAAVVDEMAHLAGLGFTRINLADKRRDPI